MPWISPQWLAGFFDGEGCINITVAGKSRHAILRLYLVNTDADLLREIQKQYGGHFATQESKKKGWKPFCTLIWTNIPAKGLLSQIGEFLILKRRQCELAEEFLRIKDDPNRLEPFDNKNMPVNLRKGVRRVKPEILEKEFAIKARMHALNKKGTDAIQ